MPFAPDAVSLSVLDRPVPVAPPRSVVSGWDPITIAVVAIAAYLACLPFGLSDLAMSLLNLIAITAVMVPISIRRAPWRGLPRPAIAPDVTMRRAAVKTLGILGGVGLMLAGWGILHAYRGSYSQPLYDAMPLVLPWLPFAVAITVWATEWRLGPYEDHGWQFGLILLGRWREVDWTAAKTGLYGWIVKGFFMPMNFCTCIIYMHDFRRMVAAAQAGPQTWLQTQDMLMHGVFLVLLVAIIPGYVFSSRLIGTENRRVDTTGFGWLVTLMCYPPFNAGSSGWFMFQHRLGDHQEPWTVLTAHAPWLAYAIGGLILASEVLHYFGEAICCLRSSHLSQRGVITTGLFRVTKHPVYVVKFIGWILIWLPFTAGFDGTDDLRLCFAFALFGVVYVLRSWVEERVMSSDPDYIAYARWMDRHSLFRGMGWVCPFFSYEWRLRFWIARGQVVVQPYSLTWQDEPLCRTGSSRGEAVVPAPENAATALA